MTETFCPFREEEHPDRADKTSFSLFLSRAISHLVDGALDADGSQGLEHRKNRVEGCPTLTLPPWLEM